MIHAITIEREFGCGASEIASLVASRLGWSLWDERLTQEIARLTESTPAGGRAERMANRSCRVQGFPGLSSRRV